MATRGNLNSQLRKALLTLEAETPGVMGAVLVSAAGLTIVSTLPDGVEPDVVAAMTAPLLALSERAIEELWQGRLSQVLIVGQDGAYGLVEKVNSQVAIVALASKEAKLGFVFMNMTGASGAIATIIREALRAHPLPAPQKIAARSVRKFRRLK